MNHYAELQAAKHCLEQMRQAIREFSTHWKQGPLHKKELERIAAIADEPLTSTAVEHCYTFNPTTQQAYCVNCGRTRREAEDQGCVMNCDRRCVESSPTQIPSEWRDETDEAVRDAPCAYNRRNGGTCIDCPDWESCPGWCPICGEPFETVRPGKTQPVCDCQDKEEENDVDALREDATQNGELEEHGTGGDGHGIGGGNRDSLPAAEVTHKCQNNIDAATGECAVCGDDAPLDKVMRPVALDNSYSQRNNHYHCLHSHADAIERLDNASAREAKRWRLKYNDLQQQIDALETDPLTGRPPDSEEWQRLNEMQQQINSHTAIVHGEIERRLTEMGQQINQLNSDDKMMAEGVNATGRAMQQQIDTLETKSDAMRLDIISLRQINPKLERLQQQINRIEEKGNERKDGENGTSSVEHHNNNSGNRSDNQAVDMGVEVADDDAPPDAPNIADADLAEQLSNWHPEAGSKQIKLNAPPEVRKCAAALIGFQSCSADALPNERLCEWHRSLLLDSAPTDEAVRVSHLLPESPVETELVDATNANADAIEKMQQQIELLGNTLCSERAERLKMQQQIDTNKSHIANLCESDKCNSAMLEHNAEQSESGEKGDSE